MLSKFTHVDRIYKINKNTCEFFHYFFDRINKKNPLKDEVYELQKFISDKFGDMFKKELLKYYHDNNFMDFSLVFIDGHVIAYFGKEAFQKLKHSTRNKIIKGLEVFNFSDKNGRIFYFNADHDVDGMQKNIEKLIEVFDKIIGLENMGILVFDRGGFSGHLFKKLSNKKIKFITLAVQNPKIQEQIDRLREVKKFVELKTQEGKKYTIGTLNIEGKEYRALLILHIESGEISPFITTLPKEELSDEELLSYYSMHWRQEQEHNAGKKLGSDMHTKALQDLEFDDTTKIKRKQELKRTIESKKNEIVKLTIEARRLAGRELSLQSKIKPKSKQTDNKLVREDIKYIDKRLKVIKKTITTLEKEIKKSERRLRQIPDNPKKKKYKFGPIDYGLSIVNLASNLNSKIVKIFSNGDKKYQLATLRSIIYCASAQVWEDEKYINIEYMGIRQDKDLEGIQRLCGYFNQKRPKLHGKIMRFSVRLNLEKTGKIRSAKN